MDLIDALPSLIEATSQEVWAARLLSIAAAYGFEHVLFGLLPNRQLPLDAALVISNYPVKWRTTYTEGGLHEVDPTVAHCFSKSVPVVWSEGLFRTADQKRLYEEASHYGLRHGISYPIHGCRGEFGMISFVSGERMGQRLMKSPVLCDLALVRDYAFEAALGFLREPARPLKPISLTPRELECLRWIADGKSSWEISRILGCAESTVNFHIANINKKFSVRTRQQAIVRAVHLGLIAPG